MQAVLEAKAEAVTQLLGALGWSSQELGACCGPSTRAVLVAVAQVGALTFDHVCPHRTSHGLPISGYGPIGPA